VWSAEVAREGKGEGVEEWVERGEVREGGRELGRRRWRKRVEVKLLRKRGIETKCGRRLDRGT
jgi:hypothetical protein